MSLGGIEMFQRILVCLDHSKLDERVLLYVSAKARKSSSKVVLLHVCRKDFKSFDLPASGQISFVPIDLILREFMQRWNQTAQYLKGIADKLGREGIEAEPTVIEGTGPVADSIRDYAQENDIDLIAMASHGRRGLQKLVFGSVAASVARMTTIPVLVVKPGDVVANSQPGSISIGDEQVPEGNTGSSVWQDEMEQGSLTV
jgi:nucleotide-binding universal stress UspA family protein